VVFEHCTTPSSKAETKAETEKGVADWPSSTPRTNQTKAEMEKGVADWPCKWWLTET
jgi:hypothetical protein